MSRVNFRSISISVFMVLLLTQIPATAQMTIVGRISGTVLDSANAAISGATVTVTQESTGLSRTVTTDASGFYVATNLPVGNYRVSAEHAGFGKEIKSGYRLDADGRVTVDFALKPGAVTQSIEVTASGETVNTVSGEISRVVDTNQVQDLALNGRNYIQLVSLVPGVALIDEDQMAVTTSLSAGNQSVNGTRTDQNLLTVDGGFDLDSGSNGSQINNVGVDFIQEVNIKTSNFSAEYGRNSGGAINVVTRSGGNQFHGGLFEFLRNDKLDAANFFSPLDSNGRKIKQKLRFNNFGWNLGGPIFKNKLYFFAGEEWKRLRQTALPTRTTLPTTAELAGNFSGICASGFADNGICNDRDKSGKVINQLYCPGHNGTASFAIKGNLFSQAACPGGPLAFTPDGSAIAALLSAMEQPQVGASFINQAIPNNTTFQLSNPLNWREDILRIDYHLTSKQSMYLRYLHDNYDITLPNGFSCSSVLPTCAENRLRPGSSYQLAHTWLVTPTLVNEANLNASWNGQRIPPVGTAWQRSTYGFTFPQIFAGGGGRFRNSIPDIIFSGTCGTNSGCPSTIKGQSHSLLSPTTDIAATDTLTWSHGAHTLKGGVVVIRNRKDQNARSLYAGSVTFNTANSSTNTTGNALADALLGNFQDYQEASSDPIGHFRYTQYHAFVTDSWKVRRNLSLELGLRYQYAIPTYTQGNNFANFDPSLYNFSQAVTVLSNGTIDATKGGNPLNGIIRAGSGVPADQLTNVPNGNSPAVLAVPAGAPRGLYRAQSVFAPRFGFAFSPFNDDKTSIRGGFGIFYDTPEGNMDFDELSNPPFATTVDVQNGNLSNPSGGKAAAAAPITISAISTHLKLAYTMSYSLSIQHELPHGVFFEMSYVGDEGRHLVRKPDINQPSLAALLANAALPTPRPVTNSFRPFPGYAAINMFQSDATSNYNAFQAYVTKRKGNMMFTGSYTWSKSLTNAGGGTDDVRVSGNNDNIQDFVDKFLNYGPAPFDRRHVFVATYSYNFPFFHDQQGFVGKALGGWEFSGITRAQTGAPFTVTGTASGSALGRRRADYLGGDINISNHTPNHWFNTAAFAAAPDTRLGNSFPGVVRGPGLYTWDLSLRKQFNIQENWRLRFQTDFFNAFNRANFRFDTLTALVANNTNINDGSFGTVTSAGPARNIQFGLKLTF
ncbi:MAG TPA: carboxypeptidase regulatory-like domain-containing protein [Terriglobales bacterium]|nr:carboxypeptidase regulatory-like domain-containing protein [Terriglobales bacterium]